MTSAPFSTTSLPWWAIQPPNDMEAAIEAGRPGLFHRAPALPTFDRCGGVAELVHDVFIPLAMADIG
jgi:hypothetical protein